MTSYCLLEPGLFAVPPVIDDPEAIFDWLKALQEFARLCRSDFREFILKPTTLIDALDSSSRRASIPTVSALLRTNDLESEFAPKDIMRTIAHLLEGTDCLGDVFPGGSLFEAHSTSPPLPSSLDPHLQACLLEMLGSASHIQRVDQSREFVVVSLASDETVVVNGSELVEGNASGSDTIREASISFTLVSEWDGFLRAIDAYRHWRQAKADINLKLAITAAAIQRHGSACTVSIGTGFWSSLRRNGAWPSGPYTHVAFAACADVLANSSTIKVDPFHGGVQDKASAGQLTRSDGSSAWRAHVTGSGVGLRLMFWRSNVQVELSRLGPKHELKID